MYAIVVHFPKKYVNDEFIKRNHGYDSKELVNHLISANGLNTMMVDGVEHVIMYLPPEEGNSWFISFSFNSSLFPTLNDSDAIVKALARNKSRIITSDVHRYTNGDYTVDIISMDFNVKKTIITSMFEQEILYNVLDKLTVDECRILGIDGLKLQQAIHKEMK